MAEAEEIWKQLQELEVQLNLLAGSIWPDQVELKALASPPKPVSIVMGAVCALLGAKETWMDAKAEVLNDKQLGQKLLGYDKTNVSMKRINYVKKNYTEHNENAMFFEPDVIKAKSAAAESMSQWVVKIIKYRTLVAKIGGGQDLSPGKPSEPTPQQEPSRSPPKTRSTSKKNSFQAQVSKAEVKLLELVQQDPDQPLSPAQLKERMQAALESITKTEIRNLKSIKRPPLNVEIVCNVICILMGAREEWQQMQMLMNNPERFLWQIRHFDIDNVSMKMIKKIQRNYLEQSENSESFDIEQITKKSTVAAGFAAFIINLVQYKNLVNQTPGKEASSPVKLDESSQPQKPKRIESKSKSPQKKTLNVTDATLQNKEESQVTPEDPESNQVRSIKKEDLVVIKPLHIKELKALNNPPVGVLAVCFAYFALMGAKEDWYTSKGLLNVQDLIRLDTMDLNNLSIELARYVQKNYTEHPTKSQHFVIEHIMKKSNAAAGLADLVKWIVSERILLEQQKNPEDQTEASIQTSPKVASKMKRNLSLTNSFNTPSKNGRPSTSTQVRASLPLYTQSMFDGGSLNRLSMRPAEFTTLTPKKKTSASQMYGNVAKLTPQQERFAQQMAQRRKEAKKQNKVMFARVRKANEKYLAEDETRQQVTYQRLYEMGTKKMLGFNY